MASPHERTDTVRTKITIALIIQPTFRENDKRPKGTQIPNVTLSVSGRSSNRPSAVRSIIIIQSL